MVLGTLLRMKTKQIPWDFTGVLVHLISWSALISIIIYTFINNFK